LGGLEVYYPTHSSGTISALLDIAKQVGLLTTGGSDFHGPGTGRNKIGGFVASSELLDALEPRLNR
jgi:predicted metal-dependent phosphoesterase TrpH